MRDKCPGEGKHPLPKIEDEIARTKAEIDGKYYMLGKAVCEIADKDAAKIGELVDKLVKLKKEHKAGNTKRRDRPERE